MAKNEYGRERIHVIGHYVDSETYVLSRPNGKTFKILKAGEPFITGYYPKFRFNRAYIPTTVINSDGSKSMVCRMYGYNNDIIKEFKLPNNAEGFWALTAEAAKKKVFLIAHPSTPLQTELYELAYSQSCIKKVKKISEKVYYGTKKSERKFHNFYSDSKILPPESEDFTVLDITGGTYLIQYYVDDNTDTFQLKKIYLTKDADLDKVLKVIRMIWPV